MDDKRILFWREAKAPNWFDLYTEPMIGPVLNYFEIPTAENISLLDLGCGMGDKTSAFHQLGMNVIGVDIDPDSIARARQNHPGIPFVCEDIHKLPFEDSSFDALFSHSVLQYIDRAVVLKECERVLKPNGKAVFIENLKSNPFVRAYRLLHRNLGWKYVKHQDPRNYLSLKGLTDFNKLFSEVSPEAFHLTTPVALAVHALRKSVSRTPDNSPNKTLFKLLEKTDSFLLKRFAPLSGLCWMVIIRARKQGKG